MTLSEPSSSAGTAEESKSIEVPVTGCSGEFESQNEKAKNIKLFIQQERQKLIFHAQLSGIPEQQVEEYLQK